MIDSKPNKPKKKKKKKTGNTKECHKKKMEIIRYDKAGVRAIFIPNSVKAADWLNQNSV